MGEETERCKEQIRKDINDLVNKIDRIDVLLYIYTFIKNKFKVG